MQALAETDRTLTPTDSGPVGADELSRLEGLLGRDLGRSTVLPTRAAAAAGRLALAALDLAPGDEVVFAPGAGRDLVATVLDAGACPVFADVDAHDGCLTADSVAAALTPRSRAVLIHHAYGAAAPIESIAVLARRHDIRVVVDETESFPALPANGTRVGDLCFADFARDRSGSGSGGCLSTDDDRLARRLRRLRDRHRATPTAAEVSALRNQVRAMAADLAARREAAYRLRRALGPLTGLTLPVDLDRHALTALPLIIDPPLVGVGNRTYATALADAGVAVLTRLYEQPLYRLPWRPRSRLDRPPVYGPGHCPVAEDRVGRTLVLLAWGPTGPADVEGAARTIARVHSGFLHRRADRTEG